LSAKRDHSRRESARSAIRVSSWFTDMPRYAVASAFSFVFIIACTAGLHELAGLSETLSPALALVLAFVVNFALLRAWVFPGQSASVGRQLAETALTSLLFRALEYGLFLIGHLGLGIDYLVATGASVCISALGKFFVYREIVFNRARARSASASSR
jgi:putative flippase GtrA